MEEWRQIAEAPDYSISDIGRVRRDRPDWQGKYQGKILAPSRHRRGYLAHVLCTSGGKITRKVHRLVCQAFNGPQPLGHPHCAHRDGDILNNSPGNLYWATAAENMADRERHGRTARGDRSGARLHPEKWTCGDSHWTRRRPDDVPRGELHYARKDRTKVPLGELRYSSKLTEEQVREILSEPQVFGVGARLARKFGVSNALITAIRKGRAWAHLSGPAR